jgi:DNA polymerase-3 subunit beta
MHISTIKGKLLNAVQLAERVVGKKESLPILSCVVIDASSELLSLKSTNLEAGIDVALSAEIEERGMVAVPATILSQTLRAIGGDKVTLKTDDRNLVIEARGTRTLIKAIPHEEFPALPGVQDGRVLRMSRSALLQGISSVSYSASLSMIRPELGSVLLSIKNHEVVFVATDSFRLAEKTLTHSGETEEYDILIPLKHAIELTHILDRIDGDEIELALDESQIAVSGAGVRFVSRIIEGNFPNYKDILPKTFTTEATVLKGELIELLRKARVFSGTEQHIGLHIYPQKKIFSATARNSDVGEMSDTMEAALSGEDIDINFNISYIADCLSSIASDSITLKFAGIGRPLVIKGVSDMSFTYLVMPLNR